MTKISNQDHGWWLVSYNDKEGLAPACFLEPYTDPMKTIGANVRAKST